MNRQQGFTLIEMVLVIVIIAIASVPIFGLFTQASTSLLTNESIQTAAQLAQERAEFLLAIRRDPGQGYAAAPLANGTTDETFPVASHFSTYTRRTVISEPYVGAGCPGGAACKEVVVSVAKSGTTYALVTFILVDY